MKVRDLMTRNVQSVEPGTNLSVAAEAMWKTDCGVLPVVSEGKVTGILTDRDICIALGTRNRRASDISAGEVAAQDVETIAPDAGIPAALDIMRRAKVRRLPVVENGRIEGILALNDIVQAAGRKQGAIDYEEVIGTMKAICEHRSRKPAVAAA